MKIRKYLIAGLAAGAAMMALSGCGSKAEIEMTDYVSVDFSGLDGEGKAEVHFDASAMEMDIYEQLSDEKKDPTAEEIEETLEDIGKLAEFENTITCELDKTEGLEIGDEVTVTISYDKDGAKDCGLKIKGETEKTFEVEGLKERVELDPFDSDVFNTDDGIEISFSGRDPFGSISVENHLPSGDPLSKVKYSVDKEENIKNGDAITVTASLTDDLEKEGYVLKEDTAIVTAGNMDRYISNELKPGMWQQIQPYCDQELTDELDGVFFIMDGQDSYRFTQHDVLSFEGITYGPEAYLATSRMKENREEYNLLIVPYYIHATLPGGIRLGDNETATGYAIVKNVIETKTGEIDTNTISVTLPDYSYTSLEQADSECLSEIRVNYDLVTVTLQ